MESGATAPWLGFDSELPKCKPATTTASDVARKVPGKKKLPAFSKDEAERQLWKETFRTVRRMLFILHPAQAFKNQTKLEALSRTTSRQVFNLLLYGQVPRPQMSGKPKPTTTQAGRPPVPPGTPNRNAFNQQPRKGYAFLPLAPVKAR